MRLSEFVDRPPALINKTADVDGIQVSVNADGAHVTAYATSNGKRLGYVVFDRDANVLVPYDLAVEERYRGQGIAAVMYDYVKSLGFKIKASDDQTDAGKYFWRKNRGRKRVWESVHAYHGTFQPTLTKFNALSHFGTKQAAEDRLKEKARREKIKTPGRVYEVVLDIKNPFIAKDFAGVHSPTHFVFDLKSKKLISQEELSAINQHMGTPKQAELLIKKLRELGFDSIAYKNKYEDKGSTSYVILDPSQVVSVRPVEQEELVEYQGGAWRLIRSMVPKHWPDYVVKDWLYGKIPDEANLEDKKYMITKMLETYPVKQWRLERLPITLDIFTADTQKKIQQREGGSKNPWSVPRDAERHAAQAAVIQKQGVSGEPVILLKTAEGYELVEGWHRTIQNLQAYPKGYTGPAWVGYL